MFRVIIVFLGILIVSCEKNQAVETPLQEQPNTTATRNDSGTFVPGPYASLVMGKAVIYKTGVNYQLLLEDFSVSNGPDLKVYLSRGAEPTNFYNLGSLRSVNGNQVYDIPMEVMVQDYSHVLVHCQQFNHLFAYAKLTNR